MRWVDFNCPAGAADWFSDMIGQNYSAYLSEYLAKPSESSK